MAERWTARELRQLQVLADQVMAQLHLRRRTEELAVSERRWRSLFEESPVAIAVTDETGCLTTVNRALCRVLGRSSEEVLGRRPSAFLRSDQAPSHRSGGARIDAAPNGVLELETCVVRPDGEERWLWVSARRIAGPARQRWTFGHLQDITSRKHSEQDAARSQADLAAVAEIVREVQAGTDARDRIVRAAADLARADLVNVCEPDVEAGALRVTATTRPDLTGVLLDPNEPSAASEVYQRGQPLFLSDAADHSRVARGLLRQLSITSVFVTPITSRNEVIAVLTTGWRDRVAGLDDRRVKLITLLADQTGVALRQAALLHELDILAHTDGLTGLPNKRAWNNRLRNLLASTAPVTRPISVAVVDLDRFKRFNDRYGHTAGDQLLKEFGTRAKAELRKSDTIARWGEEFTISLPDCWPDEAHTVLTRVLHASPKGQTCSIGFATWNGTENPEELMERADAALYRAKHSGRNRIEQAPLPGPTEG